MPNMIELNLNRVRKPLVSLVIYFRMNQIMQECCIYNKFYINIAKEVIDSSIKKQNLYRSKYKMMKIGDIF